MGPNAEQHLNLKEITQYKLNKFNDVEKKSL